MCYGVIGRAFPGIEDDEPLDQYQKIVTDLSKGVDDRREMMTFNHNIPPKPLLVKKYLTKFVDLSMVYNNIRTSSCYQLGLQVRTGV